MKKLLALFAVLAAATSLTGCFEDSTPSTPDSGDVGGDDNTGGDNGSQTQKNTLTYSTDSYVSTTGASIEVEDGVDFQLEVPTHVGANCEFIGWFTEANGAGTQLSDGTGSSLAVWSGNSATVYAHFEYNLEFTETDGVYNVGGTIKSATYNTIFIPSVHNGKTVTSVNGFGVIYPDDDSGSVRQTMETIYIPSTVTYINDADFSNCNNLKEFVVDSANISYESFNGALYGESGAKLIRVPKMMDLTNFKFPSYVTSIGDGAFKSTTITSITLPEGLTSIGKEVFSGTQLTTIHIPSTVTYIGQQAFAATWSGVATIKTITFAENSKLETIDERAFSNQQIAVINLPASVKTVAADSFEQNVALTTLTINGDTNIEGYSFYGCDTVDLIINGNASISSGAFSGGTINSLTINNQEFLNGLTNGALVNNCTNIIVKEGLTLTEGTYAYDVLTPSQD